MKKLLMIGTLCFALVVFASSALACVPWNGTCTIDYIKMFGSDIFDTPTDACRLGITITEECSGEVFTVCAEAFGTQINLGLLKAWNDGLGFEFSCGGCLELGEGPCGQGFRIIVNKIDFFRLR